MERTQGKSTQKKILFTGFGVFLLFVLVFVLVLWRNFRTVEVEGPSMEPTFHTGQRVLVSSAYWLVGAIKKGDIIVLKTPVKGDVIIKRVYALAGDKVDLLNVPDSWSLVNGDFIVPQNTVFVLGDNRPVSEDSRELGPIPLKAIIGKVVVWNNPS